MQSGLLTTALFLASVPTFLLAGPFPERFGTRLTNGVGIALVLMGNLAFELAPSYEWMLAAKALSGVGSGVAFNAGVSFIAGIYGPQRSHFGLGILGGGYPLGSALALWLMPPIALAYGWRGAFLGSSAVIAIALLAWLSVPDVRAHRAAGAMTAALRCANCWWASLQHAAGFGLGIAAGTWVTVYLVREFALPLALSGLLGALLLLATMAGRPLGGYLMSREHLATRIVMRVAQLAILAGVTALAFPGRPLAIAIAGSVLVGLGAGLPYAAVFNTAAASSREAPGAGQGLAAVGGTLGVLVLAPVIGYAVQTWGFSAAWLSIGAVSVAALAATFVMRGEEDLVRARR